MSQVADDFKLLLADILEQAAELSRKSVGTSDLAHFRRAFCGLQALFVDTCGILEDTLVAPDAQTLRCFARLVKSFVEQADFNLALSALMAQVNAYLQTEAMSIFVLERDKEELVIQYAAGPVLDKVLGVRIPLHVGVVGWVVRCNEALIVPSTDLEPRFFSEIDTHTGFETRAILCVPVVYQGTVVGAIEVLNKAASFHDDDVQLLKRVAQIISLCIVPDEV